MIAGMAAMTPLLVAAGVAVTLGAALQSATGFGFALVSAPLVFAALGPQEAIGTLLVLGTEVALLILAGERRRPRPLGREVAVILAAGLPGALAGVAVLRALDAVALQVAVTVGVLATLLARRVASRRARRPRPAWSAPAAGFAAGALSTSTNTSGPPLLLHLTGRGAEPAQVRDTITVCFLGLGAVSAVALTATRTSGAVPDPGVLAFLVPLVALGSLAGRRLFARLARSGAYEPVVTVALVAAVLTGLLTAVL
jgi:uncharacterized membrane protein YfcA